MLRITLPRRVLSSAVTVALAVVLGVTLAACASQRAARCTALRAELVASTEACDACLDRLATHGDPSVCGETCMSPGTTAPAALNACAAAAPLPPDAPASSSASAPVAAPVETAPDIE